MDDKARRFLIGELFYLTLLKAPDINYTVLVLDRRRIAKNTFVQVLMNYHTGGDARVTWLEEADPDSWAHIIWSTVADAGSQL